MNNLTAFLKLLIIPGLLTTQIAKTVENQNLIRYVDPMIGTDGSGHTYPGATTPFGMVQLSPDTEIGEWKRCSGYHYTDETILGFSHTHISGTGVGDLGDFLFSPTTGPLKTNRGTVLDPESGYRSRFSHDDETASPGYYQVKLEDYNIKAELTASKRTGFHRYTFPEADSSHIIVDLTHRVKSHAGKTVWSYIRFENDSTITGYRLSNGWARQRYIYFAARFNKTFNSFGVVNDGVKRPAEKYMSGSDLVAYMNFDTNPDEPLLIKVGVSATSREGALKNLDEEIPHWDFDLVRKQAEDEWNKKLNTIQIESDETTKRIFYTAMYHSMVAPMLFMDVDGKYKGLDQEIHQAKDFTNYTVFSLWDTYRALHPLLTIIQPDLVNDLIKSMLEHYNQSLDEMLPIWSLQANETWTMIGYHSVPVIAEAYIKGIRDYDIDKAWEAIVSTSTNPGYKGLGYYMDMGYIPIDKEKEAASKTLEFAYDDWCIAELAKTLGKENEYHEYYNRSQYYRNIFDPVTGFMRAKKSDGSFREPFDPMFARYGGDYTEGNAWQYTWSVAHDVNGLIELMGGKKKFVRKLDQLFDQEAEKNEDSPSDISGLIGQYAHGNEPSHHVIYMYNYAGKPEKAQSRAYQIMKELYDDTVNGLCGNEDCGQMSAWYILSAIGFYPVNPVSAQYDIGRPMVKKAAINLENGKQFIIEAKGDYKQNKPVKSVILNDNVVKDWKISHQEIMNGGKLIFSF